MPGNEDVGPPDDRGASCSAYAYIVYVIVDLAAVGQSRSPEDRRTPDDVVGDEIEANLDSVSYVRRAVVRRLRV